MFQGFDYNDIQPFPRLQSRRGAKASVNSNDFRHLEGRLCSKKSKNFNLDDI